MTHILKNPLPWGAGASHYYLLTNDTVSLLKPDVKVRHPFRDLGLHGHSLLNDKL